MSDANLEQLKKNLFCAESKEVIGCTLILSECSGYEITENINAVYQKRAHPLVFGESGLKPTSGFRPEVEYPHPMQVSIIQIGTRPSSKDGFDTLTRVYLDRCSAIFRCQIESFRSEEAFVDWWGRQKGRTPLTVVLLDSRGSSMTSEAFAAWFGALRENGAQHIAFAIGPADGWSEGVCARANLLLSLGRMTLAHSLARLVLAEQLYRASTILTGHPYHAGH